MKKLALVTEIVIEAGLTAFTVIAFALAVVYFITKDLNQLFQ